MRPLRSARTTIPGIRPAQNDAAGRSAPKKQRVFRPVSARTSRDSIAWDAKEPVKKYDVERRTRRTRRKTCKAFLSAGSAVSALYVISSHVLKPSRYDRSSNRRATDDRRAKALAEPV